MSSGTDVRRTLAVCGCSALIALALLCSFARSATARPGAVVSALAQGHLYRHGVVPMRGRRSASTARSAITGNLLYKGGVDGVGVVTGAPRVYLVFWGSQWGSQATNSQGDVAFSGDPMGMAPHLQEFMKGLGTGGETWSGVLTQYCQGAATGAQTCPAGAAHVAYPTGGVLAGVWVDESSAAPFQANGNQIGVEAVNAAAHFANITQTANGNVQYVIVSPAGTHPDGFNTTGVQFCAWHDYTGDSTLTGGAVSSPYGQLAFTNLPYVADAGRSCGQGFVNSGSAGALDGVTIVEGHEYAETLTDPYPSTGWIDTAGNENGDKCAWVKVGQGASQDITLSTGSFAVQSTWSNDYSGGSGGCEVSHPTVG
jgi:serine protease